VSVKDEAASRHAGRHARNATLAHDNTYVVGNVSATSLEMVTTLFQNMISTSPRLFQCPISRRRHCDVDDEEDYCPTVGSDAEDSERMMSGRRAATAINQLPPDLDIDVSPVLEATRLSQDL